MAERIDLFNPNLGLSKVLPPVSSEHLANVSELSAPTVKPSGLDSLFNPNNLNSQILSALTFSLNDKDLLQNGVIKDELRKLKKELALSRDPAARRFLKEVLDPLLENDEVLSQYLLSAMRV